MFFLNPFSLLLLLVIGLGAWALSLALRNSRESLQNTQHIQPISPQMLSSLAQPYRGLLGEAVAIDNDVQQQLQNSPEGMRIIIEGLAERIHQLVLRALPKARHGTDLSGQMLRLSPDDIQYQESKQASEAISKDLEDFVATLRSLRGKVYQLLSDSARLSLDTELQRDLDEAMLEAQALEEVLRE